MVESQIDEPMLDHSPGKPDQVHPQRPPPKPRNKKPNPKRKLRARMQPECNLSKLAEQSIEEPMAVDNNKNPAEHAALLHELHEGRLLQPVAGGPDGQVVVPDACRPREETTADLEARTRAEQRPAQQYPLWDAGHFAHAAGLLRSEHAPRACRRDPCQNEAGFRDLLTREDSQQPGAA